MSSVKTVRIANGQGIDHLDLSNIGQWAQAQIFDLLLRSKMRELETATPSSATDPRIYSLGTGGGVRNTGTNLQSSNRPGVIAFLPDRDAVPDGLDAVALVYLLADGELATTHDAAHATLDRWDLVCVKLAQVDTDNTSRDFEDATTREPTSQTTDTTRTVVLTKQVVKGTNAAAGTAVEPAVPSGFARWAAVKIPATLAGPFTPPITYFRDHRVPLAQYDVAFELPQNGFNTSDFAPTGGTFHGGVVAAGSAALCRVFLLTAPRAGRIMRLHARAKISNGGGVGTIALIRADMTNGGGSATIKVLGHTSGVTTSFDVIASGVVQDLAATPDPLVGPVWTTGTESVEGANADDCVCLAFVSGAAGDTVDFVRYEVAS